MITKVKSEHGNPFHKQQPGPCFRGLVKFDNDYWIKMSFANFLFSLLSLAKEL